MPAFHRFLEGYSGRQAVDGVSVRRHERFLMATTNVLLLVERPGGPSREELDAVAVLVFDLMHELEAELTKFEPESDIALVNQLASRGPVAVSDRVFEVLRESRRFFELTRGAFDPTVGPLMAAWGFDRGRPAVPDEAEIDRLLAHCGMEHVILDEERGTVRFDRPGLAVDLGAIGKGYIVDRAVELARERGIAGGALVSGRSTIVVWGDAPDGGRWRVGVANPRSPDEALLELEVREGAISASAAYENRFEQDGRQYGHVLDPRSGRPVASSTLGVTVWTPSSLAGDVASTALFVLGREEGSEVLDGLAPISALFTEEDSGAWGGIGTRAVHAGESGEPGFEVVRS